METTNKPAVILNSSAIIQEENPAANEQLVTVITLPEIKTTIEQILPDIKRVCNTACSLECTDESKKQIKSVRAKLNKKKAELTRQFKEAIATVKAPITEVEEQFKECTHTFEQADTELAEKIAKVEDGIKAEKAKEVRTYFKELSAALGIDYIPFQSVISGVNLSTSVKKYKDTVKAYFDRVEDDLKLINLEEFKDEIMVEYKKSLNASSAIRIVKERHRCMENERKIRTERETAKLERQKAEQVVLDIASAGSTADSSAVSTSIDQNTDIQTENTEVFHAPVVIPETAETTFNEQTSMTEPANDSDEEDTVYTLTFEVTGKRKALKRFKKIFIRICERLGLSYE